MRSKENAPDYRYFPDPDLVNVDFDEAFVQNVKKLIPELPDHKLHRIISEFDIPRNDAVILTKDKGISDFFGTCAPSCQDKKKLSHWVIKELFKLLNDAAVKIENTEISPQDFSKLINLITQGEITESIGRTVLEEMFKTGKSPEAVINEKGLKPIADDDTLMKVLEAVVAENPKTMERINNGDLKPVDFLVGQVMKKTRGKANAKKVKEIIEKKFL